MFSQSVNNAQLVALGVGNVDRCDPISFSISLSFQRAVLASQNASVIIWDILTVALDRSSSMFWVARSRYCHLEQMRTFPAWHCSGKYSEWRAYIRVSGVRNLPVREGGADLLSRSTLHIYICFHSRSILRWRIHRFDSSDANAFRTSVCDKPNCRAIREGVTPALNAARTALN